MPPEAKAPGNVDIEALLRAAFDERPSDDMPDRVTARLALVTTVIEFARMFALAPAGLAAAPDDEPPEGEEPK